MSITQKRLKELFSYDPETGFFLRKIKTSNAVKNKEKVGWSNGNGYSRICIDYKKYYCHRLAWLYVYGQFPKLLDHINGIKSDNRICNLRIAQPFQNNQNLNAHYCDNKTGYLGVSFCKKDNIFVSKIQKQGVSKTIGRFTNPKDAHDAYLKEKRITHEFCTI